MPTTILDNESFDQAYKRRFAEEAEIDARILARNPIIRMASKSSRVFEVELHIGAKSETLNVLAFTSCDAITRAIDIYFDGEDPMPVEGMMIRVRLSPLHKCAA